VCVCVCVPNLFCSGLPLRSRSHSRWAVDTTLAALVALNVNARNALLHTRGRTLREYGALCTVRVPRAAKRGDWVHTHLGTLVG
jgi:hypothetical protein